MTEMMTRQQSVNKQLKLPLYETEDRKRVLAAVIVFTILSPAIYTCHGHSHSFYVTSNFLFSVFSDKYGLDVPGQFDMF